MSGHGLRRDQVGEALGDVVAVFYEPAAFGDVTLADVAESLGAEFAIGQWRDDEVVGRLAKMVAAEEDGRLVEARRHLGFVRRKLSKAWQIQPIASEPLIPDDQAARLGRSPAAKAQVAISRVDAGEAPTGAHGGWSPSAPEGEESSVRRRPRHSLGRLRGRSREAASRRAIDRSAAFAIGPVHLERGPRRPTRGRDSGRSVLWAGVDTPGAWSEAASSSSGAVSSERTIEAGSPRPSPRSDKRDPHQDLEPTISQARRTTAALDALRDWEATAAKARDQVGLSPCARASVAADLGRPRPRR